MPQNATEGKLKRNGKRRDGSRKVGRGIVTAAGLRGPGGQDAKRKEEARGARRSFSKGEKRYLAVCDSNNESKPSQSPSCRTFYRGNVNVIPVCAISRRRRSISRRITNCLANDTESISTCVE